MRLFFSRNKPKIKVDTTKRDSFDGWIKCEGCFEMLHSKELDQNLNCCPKCDYHYRISVQKRIELLVDSGSFEEKFLEIENLDPLNFSDSKKYRDRIKEAKKKSKRSSAVVTGTATVENIQIALAVLDFNFMGGSMGSVVGEKITLLIEHAAEKEIPLVIVSASGGARMQESILSLMQMVKTSAALSILHEKRIPYISILTNPTTGGAIASFSSLGDIIIAEPGALIAFAGPRVVEQTIGEKLPEGAQRSEFLLKKGMVDCISRREDLREKLIFFIKFLSREDVEDGKERLKALIKKKEESADEGCHLGRE